VVSALCGSKAGNHGFGFTPEVGLLSLGVPSKTEHPTHGARELGGRTGSWAVDRGLKIINAKILGMALFV